MSVLSDAIIRAGHGTLPPGFAEALADIFEELEDRVGALETRLASTDVPPATRKAAK